MAPREGGVRLEEGATGGSQSGASRDPGGTGPGPGVIRHCCRVWLWKGVARAVLEETVKASITQGLPCPRGVLEPEEDELRAGRCVW